MCFPGGVVVKNLPANAGDARDIGSVPGLGRYLELEMATHSSILGWKNSTDRGVLWAAAWHGVAKNQTRLSTHARTHTHARARAHTHTRTSQCLAAAAAKSPQSCPTLCDPIDGSPPGSPIPGILQARTLEWAAISFSNAWK